MVKVEPEDHKTKSESKCKADNTLVGTTAAQHPNYHRENCEGLASFFSAFNFNFSSGILFFTGSF